MARSIEQRIEVLKRLNAPQLFINLNNGIKAPDKFEWELQAPLTFNDLTTEYPDNMPFEDDLIPLWETNGDFIVAYVDKEEPLIIKYYFEDNSDEYKVLGKTIIQAVESILENEYSEMECDNETFYKLSEILEYPNPEKLLKVLIEKYGE